MIEVCSAVPRSNKYRVLVAGCAAALVQLAAYWYWSPLLAFDSLREDARGGNLADFAERVDLPSVRVSFEAQFRSRAALLAARVDGMQGALPVGARPEPAFVAQMVDVASRPESLAFAVQTGRLRAAGVLTPDAMGSSAVSSPSWRTERQGVDQITMYAGQAEQAVEMAAVGLVFVRSGFADWRLTQVRLPAE